ncbi:hypothetical protein D9M69_528470 [compost metagenome]
MPRLCSSASISSSIEVNCENSRMRRPSESSSSSISSRLSSLPEFALLAVLFSRRGSQQAWRSLSNASRMMMWLAARPLRSISSRTFLSIASRTVS